MPNVCADGLVCLAAGKEAACILLLHNFLGAHMQLSATLGPRRRQQRRWRRRRAEEEDGGISVGGGGGDSGGDGLASTSVSSVPRTPTAATRAFWGCALRVAAAACAAAHIRRAWPEKLKVRVSSVWREDVGATCV
jgi:hypothetical protein